MLSDVQLREVKPGCIASSTCQVSDASYLLCTLAAVQSLSYYHRLSHDNVGNNTGINLCDQSKHKKIDVTMSE